MSKRTELIPTAVADAVGAVTRIVVVNFSGNTGKTTMVRHLLKPAFPDAEIIRIETINSSGSSEADLEVNGKAFEDVAKILFAADSDKIVDIGASNVELVKASLRRLGDAHEEVDMWLVPCLPNTKMIKDTLSTVLELLEIGVRPMRIKLLKNRVVEVDSMDQDFAALKAFAKDVGVHLVDRPVLECTAFFELDNKPGTMDQIAGDRTDYRAAMFAARAAGNGDAATEALEAEFCRKNARNAIQNLVKVREELFGSAGGRALQAA